MDYNQPGASWGKETVATYKAGEVIEVEWCVDNNGDHGGMFAYRICQDQAIVDKFLDPDYLPTEAEKQAAEDCFEEGLLDCNDVDGQECGYSPDCSEGEACWRNDWFTCNAFDGGENRGCQGKCRESVLDRLRTLLTGSRCGRGPSELMRDHDRRWLHGDQEDQDPRLRVRAHTAFLPLEQLPDCADLRQLRRYRHHCLRSLLPEVTPLLIHWSDIST